IEDEVERENSINEVNKEANEALSKLVVPEEIKVGEEVITDNVYNNFRKGQVSKKTISSIAKKLQNNIPLSPREVEIAKERFNQISKVIKKDINKRKDGVFRELRNAKKQLTRLKNRGVKIINTEEYKRYRS